MNIVLTPEELLHVLQTVLRTPMQDAKEQEILVSKIRKPVLTALEKEEDRLKDTAFNAWTAQEGRKIEELKQKNEEIKPLLKTARRK